MYSAYIFDNTVCIPMLRNIRAFFIFFYCKSLINIVKVLGIFIISLLLIVSFFGLDNTLLDVTTKASAFVKRTDSYWNNWNIWLNNNEVNPDVIPNTPEMIRRAGYPIEIHVITTEDGYLLTLHRIPGGNSSKPVLLQHGFFCTSAIWVILGKGKALAYLLADQGYDVWLGNFRGNTYSREHIFLSPSESKFWDFSFHELGIYDLSATITYITNVRSQPLNTFIGQSLGTTSFYVMASERPEIARKVQMMISLAPTAFMNHMTSPIRYLTFLKDYKIIMRLFFHEILLSDFVKLVLKYVCDQNIVGEICSNVMFTIWGYDREQFNNALLPVIVSHFPAGVSADTIAHYAQGYQSGKFQKYDYGRAKNLMIYNSVEPPDYDLKNITTPIALFYGRGDTLVDILDVKRLYCVLPNVVDMYEVPWPNFNHADFLWAKDAPNLVYKRVLKIMRRKNLNVTSMNVIQC